MLRRTHKFKKINKRKEKKGKRYKNKSFPWTSDAVLYFCPTVVVSYANVFVPHTHIETLSPYLSLSLSSCICVKFVFYFVCWFLRCTTIFCCFPSAPRLPACLHIPFIFSLILWHVKLNAPQPRVVGRNSATFYNNHKRRDCLCLCLSVCLPACLSIWHVFYCICR